MIEPVVPDPVDQANLPKGACPCVIRHRQGSNPEPGREFVDLYGRDNRKGDGSWYSAALDCIRCGGGGRPIELVPPVQPGPTPDQGHHDPRCPRCRGSGFEPGEEAMVPCLECQGMGQKLLRGEPAGPEADRPAP